jgi:hypothetical protein
VSVAVILLIPVTEDAYVPNLLAQAKRHAHWIGFADKQDSAQIVDRLYGTGTAPKKASSRSHALK